MGLSVRMAALVWAISFVWMATGCFLNAVRSHQIHCYVSGPAFSLGAIVAGLIAAGLTVFGPHALNNAVYVTFALALLSFVPEIIWTRNARLRG